eukprot:TRINITY_DN4023_c0_g1_i3.p1 TRINITY_DN4023_c0_g1~~TRINITY_DN4023_c0_g1_i3.p1  ORF type:complete len:226 (-),score=38.56 TRINITY_DN4023_c0_g1_i3:232-909(-)
MSVILSWNLFAPILRLRRRFSFTICSSILLSVNHTFQLLTALSNTGNVLHLCVAPVSIPYFLSISGELRARVITTLYAHLTAGAVKTPGGGGVILVQGVGVSGSAELLLLSSRRIKFSVVASGAVPHANAGGPLVFNPLVIRTSVNLFKSNRTADELVSALTGTWKLLKKQKGVSLYRLKGITNITRSLVAALRSAPDQYYLQLFFPPYPHLSDFVYAIRGTLHK